ncbi:MAG: amidohydrolase family protein, partial [Candidatus Latescibacteria bacterium]|nr:amidohydrolase family protein [Candidatus Latescibacterota bacterium]
MPDIGYRDIDCEIWEEELDGFVPSVIHDMHVHMWSEAHRGTLGGPPSGLRVEIDYEGHLRWAARLFPGREMRYLILGTPIPGMDIEGHNRWVAEQTMGRAESRASMLVTPDMAPEYLESQVRAQGFFGLKPYRMFAHDPAEARIADFLPESQIEVADQLGLAVTLHLSKRAGPADEENLSDLADYTTRFPRVQWILAHCARAFNACMLEEPIRRLRDLPNIWYDTSAVNELYTHYVLMKHED